MSARTHISALLVLAALGCGGGETAGDEDTAEPAEAQSSNGSGTGSPGVKVKIVLTGGADAGTYEGSPSEAACIDYQATGINGLGIGHYADPSSTKLAMIDFGTKEQVPVAGETDKFGFTVGIGGKGELVPKPYVVRPQQNQGSGRATISGNGPRYTVKVTGKTSEGVGVEATLECLK